jgi:glucose-1-phosphate thymidylyltransferase
MKAIILASGNVAGLHPSTKDRPKSLIVINNKPIIEHIAKKLEKLKDVSKVYIVTNDPYKHLFDAWLGRSNKVEIVSDGSHDEKDRLGAIGDLSFILREKKIKDDILVVAGDNLFSFKLKKLVKDKEKTKIGVYDVKDKELAKKYGVVKLEKKKVIGFEEKPSNPDSTLISTALYFFPKKNLKLIDKFIEQNDSDFLGDLIKFLVKEGEVFAHKFRIGKWFDIGDFESLERARKEYKG